MSSDLLEIPLFRGVAPERVKALENGVKGFDPGEKILGRGDDPVHALIIRSGTVDVIVHGVHLVRRKRDEIIGEQSLINRCEHSADCLAVSPVQALCVSRESWAELMRDPAFVQNLLEVMSDKLRESTNERYVRFGTEQRLFAEFRSHVSREVRDDLLNNGVNYGSPQVVPDVAVLFSDIRGFTTYAHESSDPMMVAAELSGYLSEVTDLIHAHGGFVDKFIGDAVMAFWGYPGTERPDNDSILRCAEAMHALAGRHTFGGRPAKIGVGINQGPCFMGNVGSSEKRQFTIIGDAVNVAARLEAKSKELGDVVVGEDFFAGLGLDQQRRLERHLHQDVRGAGTHTLYSLKGLG